MLFNFWKRKNNGNIQKPGFIQDVFFDPTKKFIDLSKHYFVIKINKDFFKKFRYNHKHLIAGFLVLLVPISFIIYSNYSFASIANFYPTKCLGGWENTMNAEGAPDLSLKSDLTEFNNLNSSRMRSGSPIYCGGFTGEIPENSKPIGFKVAFSLSIDDGSIIHEEEKAVEIIPESVEVESEKLKVESIEQPIEIIEPAPEPTPAPIPETVPEIISTPEPETEIISTPEPAPVQETPAPSEENSITAFLSKIFFKKVLAQ